MSICTNIQKLDYISMHKIDSEFILSNKVCVNVKQTYMTMVIAKPTTSRKLQCKYLYDKRNS